jgi:hypothetical protein
MLSMRLKGMAMRRAMRRIFSFFAEIGPLHYLLGRSDFGFEFAEIFVFEKRLSVSVIRGVGLPVLLSRGVDDSPHHWYEESAIKFFKRKLSVSMIRRVVDSPHQWYGESPTLRIVESESPQLRISPIQRVDNFANRWVGERLFKKKFSLASIFSTLNG